MDVFRGADDTVKTNKKKETQRTNKTQQKTALDPKQTDGRNAKRNVREAWGIQ